MAERNSRGEVISLGNTISSPSLCNSDGNVSGTGAQLSGVLLNVTARVSLNRNPCLGTVIIKSSSLSATLRKALRARRIFWYRVLGRPPYKTHPSQLYIAQPGWRYFPARPATPPGSGRMARSDFPLYPGGSGWPAHSVHYQRRPCRRSKKLYSSLHACWLTVRPDLSPPLLMVPLNNSGSWTLFGWGVFL